MNVYVNDFTNSVQIYFKELKKYKPLKKEYEKELFKEIKKNNIKARNELISSHLKFVFDVAKKYKGLGVPLEDLISEGNLALDKAIERYDEAKDTKFITYAVWWVRQAMQECVKKKIKSSLNEVSETSLNCDTDDNEEMSTIEYYNVDISSEDDDNIAEIQKSKEKIVSSLLLKLPPRGQYIIKRYYGIDCEESMKLCEISKELGITQERVRQIKDKCLKILRSEVLLLDNLNDIFL